MGTSYQQPNDRPFKVWCRVCQEWRPTTPYVTEKNEQWPPKDLSTWFHGSCKATGGMVYVFDDEPGFVPTSISEWKPACGDPQCKGYCDNPSCIPPQTAIVKSSKEELIEQSKAKDAKLAYSKLLGSIILNVIVLAPLVTFFFFALFKLLSSLP